MKAGGLDPVQAPREPSHRPLEMAAPWIPDCSGLCYPASPGGTVDILSRLSAFARATRLRGLLPAAMDAMDATERLLAQRLTTLLEELPADGLARLFSTPLAEMDTMPQTGADRFSEASVRRLLSSVRHLIHHPDVRDFALVLPVRLFSSGPLYLPHIHALLYNESPRTTLAIVEDGGCTRFVWSDGPSLTLANHGRGLPEGFDHPRLEALPIIGGLPVLNGVSDVAPLLSGFGPAVDETMRTSTRQVESALALLGEIWPLALHAFHRHVKALCILEQRGYSRSHSPPEMPGVIFMSADDVERTGDLLCHESSHVRMNIFRSYDAIAHARDAGMEAAGFVSPWRADRRPLRGLVDGVHAFLNVCRYHRRLAGRHADSWPSRMIYERQRHNVKQAWTTLREHALPTRVGALLFEEFSLEESLL